MIKHMVIGDIMDGSIVPLRPDMSLAEAVDHILESGHMGLPVVDAGASLIGFLSEQDCLSYLVSSSYYADNRTEVNDIMFKEPLSVNIKDSVLDLAQSMQTGKPKNYPVCDQGRLVGLVTRSAIMRSLNHALKTTKVAI